MVGIRDMQEPKQNAGSKISILKIFVFILCFFLLLEVLIYFVIMPYFGPVKISYNGIRHYTPAVIEQLLGENGKANWLRFDVNAATSKISSFPGVQAVSVEKKFPDSVIIQVEERVPVAMTLVAVGNRSVPVMLDKTGAVFLPMEMVKTDSELPLISGLPLENSAQGIRLDKMYRPLFEQIASLQSRKQKYFTALSEIHVLSKEYGNYELAVYPIHSRVRVLMDRNLNEEALQYMMVVLDVINTIKPDVKEVDLRYGAVSYRNAALTYPVDAGGFLER
jgi:cell division protein FtsQ